MAQLALHSFFLASCFPTLCYRVYYAAELTFLYKTSQQFTAVHNVAHTSGKARILAKSTQSVQNIVIVCAGSLASSDLEKGCCFDNAISLCFRMIVCLYVSAQSTSKNCVSPAVSHQLCEGTTFTHTKHSSILRVCRVLRVVLEIHMCML